MVVSLTLEQQSWIERQIERGEFGSIDEAACQLIEERIAERMAEEADDLAWAKPYVDEAVVELAEGRVRSLSVHDARMAALMESMKG